MSFWGFAFANDEESAVARGSDLQILGMAQDNMLWLLADHGSDSRQEVAVAFPIDGSRGRRRERRIA